MQLKLLDIFLCLFTMKIFQRCLFKSGKPERISNASVRRYWRFPLGLIWEMVWWFLCLVIPSRPGLMDGSRLTPTCQPSHTTNSAPSSSLSLSFFLPPSFRHTHSLSHSLSYCLLFTHTLHLSLSYTLSLRLCLCLSVSLLMCFISENIEWNCFVINQNTWNVLF